MPKDITPATTAAPQVEDNSAIPLSLEEYCLRRSRTDRRVEMLGAFESDARRNGHLRDTEPGFDARFTAFCNKPA
jgi:hypothetical protein